jgi:hypothetical protein
MRSLLLALPILLTLAVSGCTIPGVPCIAGITCGGDVEKTHDVIVIESLQALPNEVSDEGTIKLVAIVSNVADIKAEVTNVDVTVDLYDHCQGLFSSVTPDTPKIIKLLRGEKKQIEWTLKAADSTAVPVETDCILKVRAIYDYTTKSITTLHLIDNTEMLRRLNEGTLKHVDSYQSLGYGPIKPYINIEDSQPIAVESGKPLDVAFTIQVVNRGSGFLSGSDPAIPEGNFEITEIGQDLKDTKITQKLTGELVGCLKKYTGANENKIKLIRGESAMIPCSAEVEDPGPIAVETTKSILAVLSNYKYEFRKEIRVTVKPRF